MGQRFRSVVLSALAVSILPFHISPSVHALAADPDQKPAVSLEEALKLHPAIVDSGAVGFITPATLKLDSNCFQFSGPSEKREITVTCKSLGSAKLSPVTSVLIKPRLYQKTLTAQDDVFDAYLEFYQKGEKLPVPRQYFNTYAVENTDWFLIDVSYLNINNIYLTDRSGHESDPLNYIYANKKWRAFDPWKIVQKDFPDIQQPPFSVQISQRYLKVIEENSCCNQSYTADPDRQNYRMIYLLDRGTKKIVQAEKVLR